MMDHLIHPDYPNTKSVADGEWQVEGFDLSCLKVLGTVGEPINPEAWTWYHKVTTNSLALFLAAPQLKR